MKLSRTGLLIAGAVSIPVFTQLRSLLGIIGIEIGWRTTVGIAVVWFGVLIALTVLPASPEQTEPSGHN